jgi:hypothetical protein
MKTILFTLVSLLALSLQGQCYKVDSVTSIASISEISGRPLTFGAQTTTEQLVADQFSLCDTGQLLKVQICSVAMPEQLVNIIGIQLLKRDYIVTVKLSAGDKVYEGQAKKRVFVNAMFLTVDQIPHNKKAYSKALEKSLAVAVVRMK